VLTIQRATLAVEEGGAMKSGPSSGSESTSAPPSKDEDAVKLFVGQIPKDMTEEALRPVFEGFGPIYDLTIIRDKTTGLHRGCAFLTYASRNSAEEAIEALHNKKKLPNAQNPLQVSMRSESNRMGESRYNANV